MNDLYDVAAVSLEAGTVRLIETRKPRREAEAIVTMAVIRRGIDQEFFVEVAAGSYQEGERWVGQKKKGDSMTQPIVTKQGYRLEKHEDGWYRFYHHGGGRLAVFNEEELCNLHIAIALVQKETA